MDDTLRCVNHEADVDENFKWKVQDNSRMELFVKEVTEIRNVSL